MSWSQIHWLGMSWSWIHWLGKLCMIKRLCRSECWFCLSKDLHCHQIVITLFPCNLYCHSAVTGLRSFTIPQWGTADAEIKVPSAENPELSKVLFNAWGWSQHSTYLCILSCNSVFLSSAFQVHFNFFYSVVKWPMLWSESGTFACDVLHCVPPLDDLHDWQGVKHQEPVNHGFTCVII